jgi:hypothetical protein
MLLHLIQLYRQIFTITSSETINLHFTNQNTKIKKQKPKDLKGQWLRSYFVTKKKQNFLLLRLQPKSKYNVRMFSIRKKYSN